MVSTEIIRELMGCYLNSKINFSSLPEQGFEFIADIPKNIYFRLEPCQDKRDVQAKVLEWCSRPASSDDYYRTKRASFTFRNRMRDSLNKYLGTSFTEEDMEQIYYRLGNCVNHELTLQFIDSGYNMELLKD